MGVTWSDNFDGGTGYLENRSGWGDIREYDTGTARTSYCACVNDRVETSGGDSDGLVLFTLADATPPSADYYCEIDTWVSTDAGYSLGPIVRGSLGTSNSLTGYGARLSTSDSGYVGLFRVVNGVATQLGSWVAHTWTYNTPTTVRLTVSGTGETVTVVVTVEGTERINYGDTNAARITNTGSGGFWTFHVGSQTAYQDDFVLADTSLAISVAECAIA